ncbi:MAG: response regulator [Elusimicrobiota bacterium]
MPKEIRVLVVDDNKSVVRAIREQLEKSAFLVSEAFTGRQSIEMLNKEKFDLMTLDLLMPDMNGTDVLKWLRQNENPELKKMPVVIITAFPDIAKSIEQMSNTYHLGAKEIGKLADKAKEILKI